MMMHAEGLCLKQHPSLTPPQSSITQLNYLTGALGEALLEPSWQITSCILGCSLSLETAQLPVSWRKLAVGNCASAWGQVLISLEEKKKAQSATDVTHIFQSAILEIKADRIPLL